MCDVGRVTPAHAQYDFPDITWKYWRNRPRPKGTSHMTRGGQSITHIPELCHLVKFSPEGGDRFGERALLRIAKVRMRYRRSRAASPTA